MFSFKEELAMERVISRTNIGTQGVVDGAYRGMQEDLEIA